MLFGSNVCLAHCRPSGSPNNCLKAVVDLAAVMTGVRAHDGTGIYDNCNCTFDFLPGAAGGINPVNRHLMPSTFLPFSNLIEWHAITSLLSASSDKWRRTLASGIPVASAISLSKRSPCILRYCRISFIGSLLPI